MLNKMTAKDNKRLYLYVAVSVLIFIAVVTYNRASRPAFDPNLLVILPPSHREFASLPGAAQPNLFSLLEKMNSKKTEGWLARTNAVDTGKKVTKFRPFIASMSPRKFNVAPYLSSASLEEAEKSGIVNELSITQRPSLNTQMLPLLCEVRDGIEPKAKSCVAYAPLKESLQEVASYASKGYTGSVSDASPLPPSVIRVPSAGHMRSWIGTAAWEQQSSPLLSNYRYALNSATLGPLWMCTGQYDHWDPQAVSLGAKGMGPVTYAVDAVLAARKWNKEITSSYLAPLMKLMPSMKEGNVKGTNNGLASELLLKKVRVWAPLSAPLTEQNVQDALLRPSLVCAIVTTRPQVRTAMLQHILWGHQCDEFIVMYTIQDHEEATYGEHLTDAEIRLVNGSGIRLTHFVKLHSIPSLAKRETDGHDLAWYRIRQAVEWLEYWSDMSRHAYVYLATESVYAIPENIYALLLSPEMRALAAAGTPIYAGNRMVADIPVHHVNPEKAQSNLGVPYINLGSGVLLSSTTIRLLGILLENGQCADGALTSSPDLLLAQCLATTGVTPRDTSDVLGEDRFHPISTVEMLKAASADLPTAAAEGTNERPWWLLRHKPKLLDPKIRQNPLRLVSGMSVAFGGILTAEQMIWMHKVLKG